MNEVTIGITTPQEVSNRFLAAWESGQKQGAHIGFASEEQLWKTLTFERWQILKAMTGAGELSICEVAQRVKRDEKAVHDDIKILSDCGLLEKMDNNKVTFPYSAVHVDFMLQAA